jgi:hypothetical protein
MTYPMEVAMRRSLFTLLFVAVVASPAAALTLKEQWVSEGGASAVIIGSLSVDVTGAGGKIVFENGKTMVLTGVSGQNGVFEVQPPHDPILRRGQRLCGMDGPGVTRVLIQAGGGMDRMLTVWSGDNMCAMYPMFEKQAYEALAAQFR